MSKKKRVVKKVVIIQEIDKVKNDVTKGIYNQEEMIMR